MTEANRHFCSWGIFEVFVLLNRRSGCVRSCITFIIQVYKDLVEQNVSKNRYFHPQRWSLPHCPFLCLCTVGILLDYIRGFLSNCTRKADNIISDMQRLHAQGDDPAARVRSTEYSYRKGSATTQWTQWKQGDTAVSCHPCYVINPCYRTVISSSTCS